MDYEEFEGDTFSNVPQRRRRFSVSHPLFDPGLVREFLDQRDAWMTGSGEYVAISEMGPTHALNTASYVLDQAERVGLALLVAGLDHDGGTIVVDRVAARRMLLSTKLVDALLLRAADVPAEDVPWAAIAASAPRGHDDQEYGR